MPRKDMEKRRAYNREWTRRAVLNDEFRKTRNARVKITRGILAEKVGILIAGAKSEGCKACGEMMAECLDFHHRDPKTKSFCVGSWRRHASNVDKVADEILKCVVLCSNCHRKLHAGLITL